MISTVFISEPKCVNMVRLREGKTREKQGESRMGHRGMSSKYHFGWDFGIECKTQGSQEYRKLLFHDLVII